MIFLTSNLGANEMCALASPRLGFSRAFEDAGFKSGRDAKLSSIGVAAARRKFTPEFINRLDQIVVFKPLGDEELRRILEIELDMVGQRIQTAAADKPFRLELDESARDLLLKEGTDARYGARHLKRAIERLLVQPLSNLMASGQIRRGDYIAVSHDEESPYLLFCREAMVREGWKLTGSMAA
jgi:ATP-dependent Clp protease ATP-binding subunit ClpA